ncbi:hypothetical protein JXQ31_07165 [candidate division KSB1 bacterium]|nr:hypothetical protein [candidate division KSB1 bacterium]
MKDGYYYYARDSQDKKYHLSKFKVGIDQPLGLQKNLKVKLKERNDSNHGNNIKNTSLNEKLNKIASTTNYTLKVVLCQFDSSVYGDAAYTASDFENMLSGSNYFGNNGSPNDEDIYGSMDYYYSRMSNNMVRINAVVMNDTENDFPVWLTLPHYKLEYQNGTYDFYADAVAVAADSGIDISTNSTTKVVFIYAGNQYTGSLNPQAESVNNWYRMSEKYAGKGENNYDTEDPPSNLTFSHIGTHCHEFGHLLGFEDVYKNPFHTYNWCLMGTGNKNDKCARPAPINPFFRANANWFLTKSIPVPNTGLTLTYSETNPDVYKTDSNYFNFYIEYRRYLSFSEGLPGKGDGPGGLFIWKVKKDNFRQIDFIEADGDTHYTAQGYNSIFPGSENIRNVNDFTTNSNLKDFIYKFSVISGWYVDAIYNSKVFVHNIGDPADTITAIIGCGNNWFGTLPNDITWAGNDITIAGDVTVPENIILTITDNVTVNFEPGTNLIINGTLNTQNVTFSGAEGANIIFNSNVNLANGTKNISNGSTIIFNDNCTIASSASLIIDSNSTVEFNATTNVVDGTFQVGDSTIVQFADNIGLSVNGQLLANNSTFTGNDNPWIVFNSYFEAGDDFHAKFSNDLILMFNDSTTLSNGAELEFLDNTSPGFYGKTKFKNGATCNFSTNSTVVFWDTTKFFAESVTTFGCSSIVEFKE